MLGLMTAKWDRIEEGNLYRNGIKNQAIKKKINELSKIKLMVNK